VTFTSRMDDELRSYFSGALTGDMGLRSSCGPQLDAIAATAQSDLKRAPAWDGHSEPPQQQMTCRPSRSSASADATEIADRALHAVRLESRIRAALGLLGPDEARTLATYYVPRPAWAPEGLQTLSDLRSLVALLIGADVARALVVDAAAKPTNETAAEEREAIKVRRARAKAELTTVAAQARKLLERARACYSVAIVRALRWERDERARRFIGGDAR
jgi:hypothetical protein